MPKLKTHKGAKKRFKKTASGYKHKQAYARHILTKKSKSRLRRLRGLAAVKQADIATVKQMLGD